MNEPYQPSRPVPPGYREVQCIYRGSKEGQALLQDASNQQFDRHEDGKPVIRKKDESHEAFLKRHSRKCQVCHHPERDAIEGAFVMWRRPKGIAEVYRLRGDSLYRHAVALDLFSRRRNNFRSVLENIMEGGVETEITGETILGAVKAYACLDHNNNWVEPTSNVIFSTNAAGSRTQPVAAANRTPMAEVSSFQPSDSSLQQPEPNRNSEELEIDVTP